MCGGNRFDGFQKDLAEFNKGNYYKPTIIALDPKLSADEAKTLAPSIHHSNDVFQKELFGPVVGLVPFFGQDQAVSMANDTEFGLGCSIWTRDLVQAHQVAEKVRAGIVWINDHHKNHPSSPWGGLTKQSGIGRENGLDALREYTQSKSVVVNCNEFSIDLFQDPNARYN